MNKPRGYILIMLMLMVTVMAIGLMVAVPVWETQLRREKEEELIFRGNQYVEAVRIYQLKNPGRFPKSLDELVEEKCLRRPFKDPLTPEGEWNIILHQEGAGMTRGPQGPSPTSPGRSSRGPRPGAQPGAQGGAGFSAQKIMVAPLRALSSVQNPQILGVVSTSTKKSIKIYNDQESYDKWLFFYGQDPKNLPEIVFYGQPAKKP
jgi:type II secretory pathway pseudopilin PulG